MKTMMVRVMTALAAVTLAAGVAAAAAAEELEGALQIKGSDTMVNLCQAWAESFMTKHPKVTAAVTGGGTGTGVAALIAGTCDLAAASRKMTEKEITAAKARGADPQEFTVALDGLAVVVHRKNPVKQLTLQQLADLYTGKIRSWKELGGPDKPIVLLSREVNSGTHVYFKEHVLSAAGGEGPKEFAPEALLLPSSQAIADEASSNEAAIGYYGMGYINPNNAVVAIARAPGEPYVIPTEQAVRSGEYPISRPLLLYSRQTPEGLAASFLDFTRSGEGQQIVRETDFVPVQGTAAPASH